MKLLKTISADEMALMDACQFIADRLTCPFDMFGKCKYTEDECENRETYRCWMEYFRGEME